MVEKRKTINGDDLLKALRTLGFDEYVEPLRSYVNKYREVRTLCLLCGVSLHPLLTEQPND